MHGGFGFRGLEAGTYQLRVGRQGYDEQRIRVTVKGEDDKPLDIRMRRQRAVRCLPSRYHTADCP